MEDKNEILDELQRLSSSLAKQEKPNVVELPTGYFDSLESSIMHKIKHTKFEEEEEEEVVEEKKPQFFAKELQLRPNPSNFNYKAFAMAASLALVIGIFVVWMSNNADQTCDQLACLDQDDIQFYMESNVEDFEEMILEEVDLEILYETSAEEDLYLDEIDETLLIDEL